MPVKRKFRRNPLRGGRSSISSFTLVEMIVSMAILSILSLLLVTMLGQVSQGWATVRTQMDTRQNGRTILTQMASDIRLAALPLDRNNTNNLQFIVNPSSAIASPSSITNYYPQGIFFQAPVATDTSLGNMAEVGYFIRWDTTTNPNNPHAVLCRYFANPGTNGIANPNYLIYSAPQAWLPASGAGSLDTVAPLPSTNNAYADIVADNVIGLWVRCVDLNGYAICEDSGVTNSAGPNNPDYVGYNFNSRQGFYQTYYAIPQGSGRGAGTDTLYHEPKGSYPESTLSGPFVFTQSLPYAVEIAVVVLDARTASLITGVTAKGPTSFPITGTLASGNPYAAASLNSTNADPVYFWNEVNAFVTNLPPRIQKGARVYSTRVQLVNGVY